jgi:hypothetical protein
MLMGPWDCRQYSTATVLDVDMGSVFKSWMTAGYQVLRGKTAAELGYHAVQARCCLRNLFKFEATLSSCIFYKVVTCNY